MHVIVFSRTHYMQTYVFFCKYVHGPTVGNNMHVWEEMRTTGSDGDSLELMKGKSHEEDDEEMVGIPKHFEV